MGNHLGLFLVLNYLALFDSEPELLRRALRAMLLSKLAFAVGTLWVWHQWVAGEEVVERIVAKELAHLAEVQQVLKHGLAQEARDYTHCCR